MFLRYPGGENPKTLICEETKSHGENDNSYGALVVTQMVHPLDSAPKIHYGLIIHISHASTQILENSFRGTLVVHVSFEIIVYASLSCVGKSPLRLVISVAKIVSLARWLEIEPERFFRGKRAAI